MDFENWYRSKIESSQEEPPKELWDNLQEDLDLELVWNRIDTQLHPASQSRPGIFWKVAASVAVLIAAGIWHFLPQEEAPGTLSYQRMSPREPQYTEYFSTRQDQAPIAPSLAIRQQRRATTNDAARRSQPLIEARVPAALPSDHHETEESLPALQKIHSEQPQTLTFSSHAPQPTPRLPDNAGLLAMESDHKGISFLSLGISGEFANTWQLNAKTFRGMQRTELTNTHASFVNNLGLVAKASLSPRMALRADFRFSAQSRQDYQEYIEGKYLATSLELDYAILSVMLSRRLGSFHSPHWLSAGFYAGHLQQAHQNYNGSLLAVKNEYTNTDFGIMAGYEYHVPVWKHVYLATGIFTRYGLLNVYSGNQQVPDYMNRTRNAALIFSLSLNYSLR